MTIEFFVPGIPVTKGSAKAFGYRDKKTGQIRANVVQDNADKQRPWAAIIGILARAAGCRQPCSGPVAMTLRFQMPRPQAHYRTGKNAGALRPDAPEWHDKSNADLDKLARCVLDALKGIAYQDDGQACQINTLKRYSVEPGVLITLWEP